MMGGPVAFSLSIYRSRLSEKEKQASDLQAELAELKDSLELHRKKNNVGSPARHHPLPSSSSSCVVTPPPYNPKNTSRTASTSTLAVVRSHVVPFGYSGFFFLLITFPLTFSCSFWRCKERSFLCLRNKITHIKTDVYFDFDGLSRCVS